MVSFPDLTPAGGLRALSNRRFEAKVFATDFAGATVDGKWDATAAVQDFASGDHSVNQVLAFPPGDHVVQDRLLFNKSKCSLHIMPGARVYYAGTTDQPFVTFGLNGASTILPIVNEGEIRCLTSNDYAVDDFAAVRFIRTKTHNHWLGKIVGFTTSVDLYGSSTSGIEGNIFAGIKSFDAKNHVRIYVATNFGFVNANQFLSMWAQITGVFPAEVDSYGLLYTGADGVTLRSVNQNSVPDATIQLGNAQGNVQRRPVKHDNCGVFNVGERWRVEGGGGTSAFEFTGTDIRGNRYDISYLEPALFPVLVEQSAGAYDNDVYAPLVSRVHQTTWSSGNLVEKAWSPIANEIAVKGCFFQDDGESTEHYSALGKVLKDYVRLTSRAIGVYVDTEYYKDLELITQTVGDAGETGRFVCVAYGADGEILTDADAGHPHVTSGTLTAAATYGFSYSRSSSGPKRFAFHVGPQVKKIKVLVGPIVNLRSFQITAIGANETIQALNVYGGLQSDADAFYSTASPSLVRGSGWSKTGQLILNANAGAELSIGWRCIAEGWNAKARVANAAYVVGEMFEADGGKVYLVTSPGNVDASDGPTGTGTGITDGTAVVDYFGDLATWESASVQTTDTLYAPEIIELSSDVALDSDAYVDVPGLSIAVPANASGEFEFHATLLADAATTGLDISIRGPASPVSIRYSAQAWSSTTVKSEKMATVYDFDTQISSSPGTAEREYRVEGVLRNGPNAGTLTLRVKRELGVGAGPTVKASAYGVWRRFA